MEEAYKILDFLPIRFKEPSEQEYINFLWNSFQSNYENEKYQFSFMAYHMLFMSFVYFNVWQIKKILGEDYGKIILGFNKVFETATTPFLFSQENESKIFLLFKLFGLDDSKIGRYKNIVKLRNEVAHSNGNIFFKSRETLDNKINKILIFSKEIQSQTKSIIQKSFKDFLKESQNKEEREFYESIDQINEILIHQNYLSLEDIKFCLEYDINELSNELNFIEIKKLYETLKDEYYTEQ